ncbi:MAG: hypothetical protein ACI4CS_05785, partial [Candidatus Weimeria sp.]
MHINAALTIRKNVTSPESEVQKICNRFSFTNAITVKGNTLSICVNSGVPSYFEEIINAVSKVANGKVYEIS